MSRPLPALAFAHYFGGSARSWAPLTAALEPGFECLVLNLPGFGGTLPPQSPLSLMTYADAFAAVAPNRAWIAVGHSMGGKIALATALRQPPGLSGLILIAPSPPTPQSMSEAERCKTLAAFGDCTAARENLTAITEGSLPPALFAACVEDLVRVDHRVWNWWLECGSRDDIASATATLDLPVLVITGTNDRVLGQGTAPGVVAGLRGARLLTIATAGHLVPLERPAAVAAAIYDFAAHVGERG